MNKYYVFDLDGTLTYSRIKIEYPVEIRYYSLSDNIYGILIENKI